MAALLSRDYQHLRMRAESIEPVPSIIEYKALLLLKALRSKNFQLTKILLELGVDPNFDIPSKQNEFTNSLPRFTYGGGYMFSSSRRPLHVAATSCDVEFCKLLLNHGADPNWADDDGNTSLHVVVRDGAKGAILMLVDCAKDINAKNIWGYTPFIILCDGSYRTEENYFLKYGPLPIRPS
jgi:ankyrin repeat protein